MARQSNSSSGGIGFAGLLTIVFIVLKLLGVIKLSALLLRFLRTDQSQASRWAGTRKPLSSESKSVDEKS